MDLAKQIQAARRRHGLSQAGAAREWNVKLSTLQAWEQGKNKPSADALLKLLPLLAGGDCSDESKKR